MGTFNVATSQVAVINPGTGKADGSFGFYVTVSGVNNATESAEGLAAVPTLNLNHGLVGDIEAAAELLAIFKKIN